MAFLDQAEHGEQHRQIREFVDDWYCYWDGSYGMPKNAVTDFGTRDGMTPYRLDRITQSTSRSALN